MRTFFTSDTHFADQHAIEYFHRPFKSTGEMNGVMVEKWNSVVTETDTVYHLGDVTLDDIHHFTKWISLLNGNIKILPGSHDHLWLKGFVASRKVQVIAPLVSVEFPEIMAGNDPQIIVLCHYSMQVWDRSNHGAWHLFGHSHGKLKGTGLSFDVSVDCTGFTPLSLEEVASRMAHLKGESMVEIIDLSQEIFTGMPVFPGLPDVNITMHVSHEEWDDIKDSDTVSPAVNRLELGEHTGTHVDAINHMARQYRGQSIDTMPLTMFYTEGICLDLSHKGLWELIEPADLDRALSEAKLAIEPGDTVLLYTDHYRRAFGTDNWHHGPGISVPAARWLGEQKIAAFGVETMAPGVLKVSNKAVHYVCGEMGFTHYENMINLHLLTGRGRFRFIGLPLRIRGGTGSPVRAVAVFEE